MDVWIGVSTVISAVAAAVNAILVWWLIRVTMRYVDINQGLLEASRASLEDTRGQIRGQQRERAGPVLAAIVDTRLVVTRWRAWCADTQQFAVSMLNTRESFLPANFETGHRDASRISLAAYTELSFAKQQLELFAGIVVDTQRSASAAAMTDRYPANARELASRISEASEFLDDAAGALDRAVGQIQLSMM